MLLSVSSGPDPLLAGPAASPLLVPFSRAALITIQPLYDAHRAGPLADEQVARAAGLLAGNARAAGLTAGELVIGVKHTWSLLHDARALPSLDARDLLDRLVSRCIRAYYAPQG